MAWQGLTRESKNFCGYRNKSPADKARWWLAYIFSAAPRFWWYCARDAVRTRWVRWKYRNASRE